MKNIKVKSPEGKQFEVSEKAYNVVYKGLGYKEVKSTSKKSEKE